MAEAELIGFIRKADAVVYLLSPSSINSKWCKWEVEQVAALNKRLAPIVAEALPADATVPEIVSRINFLPFTPPNDFEEQAGQLGKGTRHGSQLGQGTHAARGACPTLG